MGEIAQDMMNGLCCCQCGIYFRKEHGIPVFCTTCYAETDESIGLYQQATQPELTDVD